MVGLDFLHGHTLRRGNRDCPAYSRVGVLSPKGQMNPEFFAAFFYFIYLVVFGFEFAVATGDALQKMLGH